MKKSEALNTFNEGLIMDLNPIVTPNDIVTNCLNGTLITFNGNENVLQNDMGNGRVETAFLPEGYIPLGTTELGGIIYIVSYNPLNGKCQIGSFPSPERNITSDEVSEKGGIFLNNSDFKYDSKEGAKVYYIKKEFKDPTFHPGDKFIIYGDNISSNYNNFYKIKEYEAVTQETLDKLKTHTLKLEIGALLDSGKVIKLENLKDYTIDENNNKFYIYQKSANTELNPEDIDEYRNLTDQPYNIFSSKISGKLCIIAELVKFDNFSANIAHKFDSTDQGHKIYNPEIEFVFSSDFPFIPRGVKCNLELVNEEKTYIESYIFDIFNNSELLAKVKNDNKNYTFQLKDLLPKLENDIYPKIQSLANEGYFDTKIRNKGIKLKYTFIPCMNWGEVAYLSASGEIDLDKLGTGYINLTQWRYYNNTDTNRGNLTWGLETYEEEGYRVSNIKFTLTRLISPTQKERIEYSIPNKYSYFGVFQESFPYNSKYYRFNNGLGSIQTNNLYLVDIEYKYENKKDSKQSQVRTISRWLYTNEIFNDKYSTVKDFKDLKIELTSTIQFSNNNTSNYYSEFQKELYGYTSIAVDSLNDSNRDIATSVKGSLSAIQNKQIFTTDVNAKVKLLKDYNTFYLDAKQNSYSIQPDTDSVNGQVSTDIKYIYKDDNNSSLLNTEAKKSNDLSLYILNENTDKKNVGDYINTLPSFVYSDPSIKIESYKENNYKLKITQNTLQTTKAYCGKHEQASTYQGYYIPLAYNEETFKRFNLEYEDGKWRYSRMGLYGMAHNGDSVVRLGYGLRKETEGNMNARGSHKVEYGDANTNWSLGSGYLEYYNKGEWNSSLMFVGWQYDRDGDDDLDEESKLTWHNTNSLYSESIYRDQGYLRVEIFVKNLETGYYLPIQCSQFAHYNPNTVQEPYLVSAVVDQLSILNTFVHEIAITLNNIYQYINSPVQKSFLVPEYIYWRNSSQYNSSFNIKMSKNEVDNNKVYIQLENGKIELNSIYNIITGETKIPDDLNNNIESIVTYPTITKNITTTYKESLKGIQLRDKMVQDMNLSKGICVFDYNGYSVINDQVSGGNSSYVYMRDGNNIKVATAFIPKHLNYSYIGNNTCATGEDGWLYDKNKDHYTMIYGTSPFRGQSPVNLNQQFIIQDGQLYLRSQNTGYSFHREANDENGDANGYSYSKLADCFRNFDRANASYN